MRESITKSFDCFNEIFVQLLPQVGDVDIEFTITLVSEDRIASPDIFDDIGPRDCVSAMSDEIGENMKFFDTQRYFFPSFANLSTSQIDTDILVVDNIIDL